MTQPDQSTAAPAAQQEDVHAKAKGYIDRVCEGILDKRGRAKVSVRVKQAASAELQTNTVILAGEVNRGKSSLANALVGWQGVSPSSTDFTTVIPIAIGPETEEIPAGSAALISAEGTEIHPLTELPSRVDRALQSFDGFVPTRAHIAVDGSKMGDTIVIDTPGIGGIGSADSAVQADTENFASVVVVVADASSPLTKPEMDFLKHAHEVSASVVVAVTKTDKNMTRWRDIVAEDEKLIAAHVGENIPVIGVSSLLPFAELGTDDDNVDAFAGLARLRKEIADRFASAESLPVANALRIMNRALEDIEAEMETEQRDLEQAEDVLPELEEQKASFEELRQQAKVWERHLNRDLQLMRQSAADKLDEDLMEIRTKWTDFIDKHGIQVLRKDPQHFTRLMEEDFQRAVVVSVSQFGNDVEAYLHKIFGNSTVPDEIIAEIREQLHIGEIRTAEVNRNMRDTFDPMMLMMGFSGGSTIGGLLGAALVPGVGIIAGAAWFGVTFGFRAIKSGKSQLKSWLNESRNSAVKHTNNILTQFTLVAQPLISARYTAQLEAQLGDLKQRIARAQKTINQRQETRNQRLEVIKKNRSRVRKAHGDAETMIDQLTARKAG